MGLSKYIGVAGLIRHNNKLAPYNNTIVEGEVFLKEEYMGSGLGFKIERIFTPKVEERGDIVIASIWEHNIPSIRMAEKLGAVFIGKITKCYNGKTVNANIYIRYPASLKNTNPEINLENFFITGKIT